MSRAGFVLVGGRSSRMGRDKALLEIDGSALAVRTAAEVARAAGSATLIGDPEKYGFLGYPVIRDYFTGCGPLAGIHAALAASRADWNLVVACDMPDVTAGFLVYLLESAERLDCDCMLPAGPAGLAEPLCAVYSGRSRETIQRALESGVRKVLDGLAGLRIHVLPVSGASPFRNLNTAEDWVQYRRVQVGETRTDEN